MFTLYIYSILIYCEAGGRSRDASVSADRAELGRRGPDRHGAGGWFRVRAADAVPQAVAPGEVQDGYQRAAP